MIATVLQGLPGAATSATQAGAPAVTPNVTWGYLAPILIMFGGALLLLLLGALMPNGVPRHVASFGTVVVGLASMASGVPLWLRIHPSTWLSSSETKNIRSLSPRWAMLKMAIRGFPWPV